MSTQKCECPGGGMGLIGFVVFLTIGLSINGKLTHVAEWCKRDGVQRSFAVVKPDKDGSGDVHVEWKTLDTKEAAK